MPQIVTVLFMTAKQLQWNLKTWFIDLRRGSSVYTKRMNPFQTTSYLAKVELEEAFWSVSQGCF